MPEPSFGQLYHTQDGKTVFIDPKTNQATVFDGVKTLEQILEPKDQITATSKSEVSDLLKAMMAQLPMLSMTPLKFDFVLLPGDMGDMVDSQTDEDILGPKDYYVLVPKENDALLKLGATKIYAWVSEHKKGHKPDYKGHSKHRILPEQFDWLMKHKECSLVAWYSQECPAFVSVACQSHAKAIQPMLTAEKIKGSSEAGLFVSSETMAGLPEAISAEERVV